MPEDKPSTLPPAKEGEGEKTWTTDEKLRLLAASAALTGEEFGAFLRREGLQEDLLKAWRDAAAQALSGTKAGQLEPLTYSQRHRLTAAEKELKALRRELRRKDKALAEAAALLILEKKLQALGWDEKQSQGDEEDDAPGEERED